MQRRKLGTHLEVSALGLGCMGMSEFYGPRDDEMAMQKLAQAVERGIDFLDTADISCSAAQIALAWLLAQGDDIVPIPGTRRIAHLRDNLGALWVCLWPGDLAELHRALDVLPVAGERYTEEGMKGLNA